MFARLIWENTSWNLHETGSSANNISSNEIDGRIWIVDAFTFKVDQLPTVRVQTQMRHIKLEMFTFIIRLFHLWGVALCVFWYLFSYLYKNEETYFTSFPLGLIIIYSLRFSGHHSMELFIVFAINCFNFSLYFSISLQRHINTFYRKWLHDFIRQGISFAVE